MAPRRPRPLQPRREPQGRGGAVRVSGDLHDATLAQAKAQHLPLGRALQRIRRRREQARAAVAARCRCSAPPSECPWLKAMVDAGEIYHPLRWTPAEALSVPDRRARASRRPASSCGCRRPGARIVRRARRSRRPSAASRRRASARTRCSTSRWSVTLDGEPLTDGRDRRKLLAASNGLAPGARHAGSRSIATGSAGCSTSSEAVETARRDGRPVVRRGDAPARRRATSPTATASRPTRPTGRASSPGRGWRRRSPALRDPDRTGATCDPGAALKATLRPYQQAGVRWLHLLSQPRPRRLPRRRHGPRQDDPGAGAAAGAARRSTAASAAPSLLVVPASLLANWAAEIARFAPSLQRVRRASVGDDAPRNCRRSIAAELAGVDLVITSYGIAAARARGCSPTPWRLAVLDEAQAIKNPGAKQTRAVKQLDAPSAHRADRHAGREPARRSLVDLRLPQSRACSASAKAVHGVHQAARRRGRTTRTRRCATLVRPYILRRLKTDKTRHRRPAGQDRGAGVLRA